MVLVKKEESPERTLFRVVSPARLLARYSGFRAATSPPPVKKEEDFKPLLVRDHAVVPRSSRAIQLFQDLETMDLNDPNYSLQRLSPMDDTVEQDDGTSIAPTSVRQAIGTSVSLSTAVQTYPQRHNNAVQRQKMATDRQQEAIKSQNETINRHHSAAQRAQKCRDRTIATLKTDNETLKGIVSGMNNRLCVLEAQQGLPQQPLPQYFPSLQPLSQLSPTHDMLTQQTFELPQQTFELPQQTFELPQQPFEYSPFPTPAFGDFGLTGFIEDPFLMSSHTNRTTNDFLASPKVDDRSRSPTPTPDGSRFKIRDNPSRERSSVRGSNRKRAVSLRIDTSGKKQTAGLQNVLPTPLLTGAQLSTPTKGFITPVHLGPPIGTAKTKTFIAKRSAHNLDQMVPHANIQIPVLPLTDTEIVVFFFNALARPIVSLRLYANAWGPKSICEVLNGYRNVEPEYLRNTCSVKCTTAIKKGQEKYGLRWENENRKLLEGSDTSKATDLIRLKDDDDDVKRCDWDLRLFCNGLKKFPIVGEDGGIFTKCVQYCYEKDRVCKLSEIEKLAMVLDDPEIAACLGWDESNVTKSPAPKAQQPAFNDLVHTFALSDFANLHGIDDIDGQSETDL